MKFFYSVLFILFVLNGCSRADLISDVLNSLQQQQPNLGQLTTGLTTLAQLLQQNGGSLSSFSSLEQQLNQLSQQGQQSLNTLPFSVTNLTTILANINWNQLLANVTTQLATLQSQLNSAQNVQQSLTQIMALFNSSGKFKPFGILC